MQFLLFGEPTSDWSAPEVLPDLSQASIIAFDCESRDPYLKSKGPGFVRGEASIVGISLATDLGHKIYLPTDHQGGGNLDKGLVKRYVRAQLSRPNQTKIAANILYDLEALFCDWGITVEGPLRDVQVAEALIDENQRTYNLERISRKYLDLGKNTDKLKEALKAFFRSEDLGNLWRLPAKFVGPYAETDSALLLEINALQEETLQRDGLSGIYDLEMRLVRCLLYMRVNGVPVDVPRAERALVELQKREAEAQRRLNHACGLKVSVWAANSLQAAYDVMGIEYPKLVTGNASFTAEWLNSQTDELSTLVLDVRKINRMWSTFVKGQVLDTQHKGRVHCQFHPLRSDDGGTVTGRLSSSGPNLQQVPSPEKNRELATFARGLFIPEQGCDWHCNDFSQVEPKIQLHYALLRKHRGADEAYRLVMSGLDFHTLTAELTGLPRKQAKTINLGLAYGMGVAKLALDLGVTESEAREILAQYHLKMPWLKGIIDEVNERAADVGYITTLLGRRRRFDTWEPGGWGRRGQALPSREMALESYGAPVRRAFTHKGFNALVQGSAADAIKKVMVDIYESGVLNEGAHLHLTVHDELDFSVDKTREDTAQRVIQVMQDSIKLRVPLHVDNERGPSWGEVEKAK